MPRPLGMPMFIAWSATSGRAHDVADALGGTAVLCHPQPAAWLPRVPRVLLRYLLSAVLSLQALRRERPGLVIATNPPVFPGLVAGAWARAHGARFVLDSHPTAFGGKGHRVSQRLQPLHRAMARRATAVLVTTEDRAREVDGWGGRGLVFHEAPVPFPDLPRAAEPTVLFVGIFASDEPVEEVVEAARALPDVVFQVTGDLERAPAGLVAGAPPNVRFVGYLAADDYRRAMVEAHVVLALTTEPTSVMRAAYEAVYARTPLVASGTDAMRAYFPAAVHCRNDAAGIAAAVARVLADPVATRAGLDEAVRVQSRRWEAQIQALRAACAPAAGTRT